jgi:hypothetical protein
MANTKKYRGKKGTEKKSASRGKTKVVDTFECGFCRPIVTVDECGCMETCCLC